MSDEHHHTFAAPIDDDAGLSLDDLSEAYARLLDQGATPYADEPASNQPDDEIVDLPLDEPAAADAGCEVSPRSILEAMLFVGSPTNQPLTSTYVASLMRGVRPAEIDQFVVELNAEYDRERRPYRIESHGAGYTLALRSEYGGLRDRFHGRVREARLSQAAVDVLAIVAYQQPIAKSQIEKSRGAPCGALLSQLVRRQLLVLGRGEKKSDPSYSVSQRFLELLGLESLADLPRSHEDIA